MAEVTSITTGEKISIMLGSMEGCINIQGTAVPEFVKECPRVIETQKSWASLQDIDNGSNIVTLKSCEVSQSTAKQVLK